MAKVNVGERHRTSSLPAQGNGRTAFRLPGQMGDPRVLPRRLHPVCTRQFCSYRDGNDRLNQLGVEVLGMSPQSVGSHERFAAKHGLTVPLLADETGR